jgi:hypothetical protein
MRDRVALRVGRHHLCGKRIPFRPKFRRLLDRLLANLIALEFHRYCNDRARHGLGDDSDGLVLGRAARPAIDKGVNFGGSCGDRRVAVAFGEYRRGSLGHWFLLWLG